MATRRKTSRVSAQLKKLEARLVALESAITVPVEEHSPRRHKPFSMNDFSRHYRGSWTNVNGEWLVRLHSEYARPVKGDFCSVHHASANLITPALLDRKVISGDIANSTHEVWRVVTLT